MAKKEPLIKLGDLLNALNSNDVNFYKNLTADQKKEFSPWLTMRWSTSVDDSMAPHFIVMTHEIVNKNFSLLNKHPELQWQLLSLVGLGRRENRKFIRPGKTKKKNKLHTFLRAVYPSYKDDDIELLIELNSKPDLKELAREHGYQEDEIKEIFK